MEIQHILDLPFREFTTTEKYDIESCPYFTEDIFVEDSVVRSMNEDKLEAVGDNLYRIVWNDGGEFPNVALFTNLQQALAAL